MKNKIYIIKPKERTNLSRDELIELYLDYSYSDNTLIVRK